MFHISLGVQRQLTVALICSLVALTTGCFMGWQAPTLKKLRQPDSPLHLRSYQEGWVVSALFLGQTASPLPSGFIMRQLGPKRSLQVLGALSVSSWILVYFGTSALAYAAAQFVGGLWVGATLTLFPIYMAEISEPHVRGTFGPLYMTGTAMGVNGVYMVAPWVSVRTMAVIGGVFLVIILVLFTFCPESPYFHVGRKDGLSAGRSLSWLRGGKSQQTELELHSIQIYVNTEASGQFLHKFVALTTVPANRRAFITVAIINAVDGFCGVYCISAFISVILPPRLGPFTPEHCTVMYGFVNVFCPLLMSCMGLTNRVGHKALLRFTSLGMCVSMFGTGVWYFLDGETSVDLSWLNWVPLVGFLVFGCFYSAGLGPVVVIAAGEMFPSDLKGPASALTTMVDALSAAVSTALFPVLSENFGLFLNFFVFGVVAFLNLLFAHFFLIETAGKSLQSIQAELNGLEMGRSKRVGEATKLLNK